MYELKKIRVLESGDFENFKVFVWFGIENIHMNLIGLKYIYISSSNLGHFWSVSPVQYSYYNNIL